jgi:hypothetical protein
MMQIEIAVPNITINFPKDGKIRSRKVVKRSNARNTGKYPSCKMQRMLQWESVHESNAMRLLDADPNVLSFHEQPCEIIYQLNGASHRHYPDLLVKEKYKQVMIEVKSSDDANAPEILQRTTFLTSALPHYGYEYRVLYAEDLARQPRLDNLKTLLKFGRFPLPLVEQETLRQMFLRSRQIRWEDLCEQGHLRKACRLILEGKLSIDIDTPLNTEALVHHNFNA